VVGLQSVVESYLATPYRLGASGREGLDCSAFVQQVFRKLDISLPRSAREQYWYGDEVDRNDLRSGDLLFFRTYALYPSHVGIYLGEGKMAHASTRSHKVVASDITQPYYRKRFIGAKRFAAIVPTRFDFTTLDAVFEEPPELEMESGTAVQFPLPESDRKDQ
jgi:cell wall-associated NlpC family hydrolase